MLFVVVVNVFEIHFETTANFPTKHPTAVEVNSKTMHPRRGDEEKKDDASSAQNLVSFRERTQAAIKLLPTKEDDLLKYYKQAKTDDKDHSFILIFGCKWSAKTEMALTLKENVEYDDEGYFLGGSYTRLNLFKPHSALLEATETLTRQVLARGEAEMGRVRKKALEALGDDVELLVSILPSFQALVGKSCKKKKKQKIAREAKRFVPVLGSFFQAVASPERPIVFFLENIDLADAPSLDAVKTLVVEHHAPGLIFMATSDADDSPMSELSSQLRNMEKKGGVTIRNITINTMSEDEMVSVVSSALECEPRDCQSLCQFLLREAKLTPMSLSYLLEHLISSNMIFGTAMFGWSWDERGIRKALKKDPACLEVQEHTKKLGGDIFSCLTMASCLGVSMSVATLDTISGFDSRPLIAETALKTSYVHHERGEDDLSFSSEDVRQALYEAIPERERNERHFAIGKTLWKQAIAEDTVEENVFLILGQVCKGVDAVSKEKEKKAVAQLCLLGGQKASKFSAFHVASYFLRTGISLLSESSWRDEYDLMYSLHTCAAEMSACEASFGLAEILSDSVVRHSRCLDDMIPAYCTRIMVLYATERTATAVDTSMDVLSKIGVRIPTNTGLLSIHRESQKVKRLLRGMSDEQLLRIPRMTNLTKMNAMKVLTLVNTHTVISRVELHSFTCLKMMQLTLEYGHSVMSAMAFAAYGMHQVTIGNLEDGYRYAKLSLAIHKEHGAIEYHPRVILICHGFVFPWKKPFEQCLGPLLDARNLGFQIGDGEVANHASNVYCYLALESGKRLDLLLDEWTAFQKAMASSGQKNILRMSMAAVQTIRHLMGLTENPLDPKGDVYDFDEAAAITLNSGATKARVSLRTWQMRVAYFFNDYALASKYALLEEMQSMPSAFGLSSVLFIGALVRLQACREERDRGSNLRSVRNLLTSFRKWSLACPENYSGRKLLIEAELASVEGHLDEAYEAYICAIACSRHNPCEHALASERLARHLVGLGDVERATPFFHSSISSYLDWGAKGKAAQLQDEVHRVLDSKAY